MEIRLTSVMVDDQDKALEFYTEVLGFLKKKEIPMGTHKWLTVVSKLEQDGPELLLEPTEFPAAKIYQKALFKAGIPLTVFHVDHIEREYERLKEAGVEFKSPPIEMGQVKVAVFNDTCGNLIQLIQAVQPEIIGDL